MNEFGKGNIQKKRPQSEPAGLETPVEVTVVVELVALQETERMFHARGNDCCLRIDSL